MVCPSLSYIKNSVSSCFSNCLECSICFRQAPLYRRVIPQPLNTLVSEKDWFHFFLYAPSPLAILEKNGRLKAVNLVMLDIIGDNKFNEKRERGVEEFGDNIHHYLEVKESLDETNDNETFLKQFNIGRVLDRQKEDISSDSHYEEQMLRRSRQVHRVVFSNLKGKKFMASANTQNLGGETVMALEARDYMAEYSARSADKHILSTPFAVLVTIVEKVVFSLPSPEDFCPGEDSSLLAGYEIDTIKDSIATVTEHLKLECSENKTLNSVSSPLISRDPSILPTISPSEKNAIKIEHRKTGPLELQETSSLFKPTLAESWILSAEDEKVAGKCLKKFFSPENSGALSFELTLNGQLALEYLVSYVEKYEKAHHNLDNFPSGLITMDNQMPEMGGIETTRKMISFLEKKKIRDKVVIIGLTGNSSPEELALFKKAGVDEAFGKPIDFGKVVKTFNELQRGITKVSNLSEAFKAN
jgi:CheY-like chemotaxis protein